MLIEFLRSGFLADVVDFAEDFLSEFESSFFPELLSESLLGGCNFLLTVPFFFIFEAGPAFGVFLAVGVDLGFFLISESESDLFDFFCTLASSTEEDSLDFLALDLGDLADAGISLLRAFFASSKAESSPKIVKFMVKVRYISF